jgi:hypothetical protein
MTYDVSVMTKLLSLEPYTIIIAPPTTFTRIQRKTNLGCPSHDTITIELN